MKDERKNKTTAPGEEISVDVAFMEGIPVLLLSDTGSGLTMGSIMGRKSEAAQDLEQMVTYMEKQFQVTVKRIISDNGGEFMGVRRKDNLDRGSVGMSKLVGSNGNEEPHKEWRQKSRNNGGPYNYAKIVGIELETWNEAN